MNQAVLSLLEGYDLTSPRDYENALREILQHLALLGLWRSRFWEHAAFYGGTALRVFGGLGRYSEDLDFSLLSPSPSFEMRPFLHAIEEELTAFGFSVSIERKSKEPRTPVESAFVKADTRVNLLAIDTPAQLVSMVHRNQRLRIKLDVDTDPPQGARYEVKTVLVPIPFQVRLFSLPDLFAGKLHAVLCRGWKSRIKGRDFYDFVWFVGRGVSCRLEYLKARMVQTGHWKHGDELNEQALKGMLDEKFRAADIEQVRNDVRPFVRDPDSLALWSTEFFADLAQRVTTV